MSELGDAMLAEARKLIGVPWVHMGRTEHGVDCVGVLLISAWRCNIDVPDVRGYGRAPDGFTLSHTLQRHSRQLFPVDGIWPFEDGDMLRTGHDVSSHVGMMGHLPDGSVSFLHCPHKGRVSEVRWSAAAFPVRGLYRPVR